eukprot:TRINITY_DN4910_c0_g1_i1.p2 TRINITY_DN4910_c0_g1~~TRINITY_DN4910_c0_g1_i1.p2  ORF type:complete len:51 (+),score=1.44 TRINITY_DN4910_c0_g1_i1:110-262(+)
MARSELMPSDDVFGNVLKFLSLRGSFVGILARVFQSKLELIGEAKAVNKS